MLERFAGSQEQEDVLEVELWDDQSGSDTAVSQQQHAHSFRSQRSAVQYTSAVFIDYTSAV